MKRFTDTEKFQKDFYRNLPAAYKLLWEYLCCECDTIGLWRVEEDVAKLRLGKDVEVDFSKAIVIFNKEKTRVLPINNGKQWFLVDFISFQYGNLTSKHTMYKKIIQGLKDADLERYINVSEEDDHKVTIGVREGYHSPMIEYIDMDIDIDKDKDNGKAKNEKSAPMTNRQIAEKAISLFRSICPTLPKPMVTEARVTKSCLRIEEMGKKSVVERASSFDPEVKDGWDVYAFILRKVNSSSFLKGENERGWSCNYDWLMVSKNNWIKVLEGYYDDKTNSGTSLAIGQVIHSEDSYNF